MKKRTRILVVLGIGLAVAGGAAAYFGGAGAGQSTASVGSIDALTIRPATPGEQLYPGGTADVVATIDNPNGMPAKVTSLALDTGRGIEADSGHSGCDTSSLHYATQSTGWSVPAQGTLAVRLRDAVTMDAAAAAACQGAVFTVYLQAGQ